MPYHNTQQTIEASERETMHHAGSILLAANLLLISVPPLRAAETPPPAPTIIGTSQKVCQLTGDTDWETGQPTAARTLTNFGLDAVDLGYPVEHDGKLFFLFGDTRPATPCGGRGPAAEIPAGRFGRLHHAPGAAGQ